MDMMKGLVWWRFTHVNPVWGFAVSGRPHLLVTPRKPAELIAWIDAAIKVSGVPETLLKNALLPKPTA
jgi:hypothetical protein